MHLTNKPEAGDKTNVPAAESAGAGAPDEIVKIVKEVIEIEAIWIIDWDDKYNTEVARNIVNLCAEYARYHI